MRNRAIRPIIATLAILVLTGVPTQAAPVAISDVIQVLGNYRISPELRVRNGSQYPSTAISTHIGPMKPGGDAYPGVWTNPTPESLFSGIVIDQDPQRVDVVVQGDVEATICDCGEIMIPEGGFPKWPLLFIGAIPFFFIDKDDEIPVPPIFTPTPPTLTQPTPTPPPVVSVPEPASLLLFTSGLAAFAAGLRRRYSRPKSDEQIQTTEGD
jgi:PEP-CTERM motif